jgi:hypothetical protein
MTDQPFEIGLLGQEDRSGFRCGSEPLDRYLQTLVGHPDGPHSGPSMRQRGGGTRRRSLSI